MDIASSMVSLSSGRGYEPCLSEPPGLWQESVEASTGTIQSIHLSLQLQDRMNSLLELQISSYRKESG